MASAQVDLKAAITILEELGPGAILGVTARPGHKDYEKLRTLGLLCKCTCGQEKAGWVYPEFIVKTGDRVWTVGRDAKTNIISCGTKGYHSARYGDSPACC